MSRPSITSLHHRSTSREQSNDGSVLVGISEKEGEEELLLRDAYARRVRQPTNHRQLRVVAFCGWAIAFVLFFILATSAAKAPGTFDVESSVFQPPLMVKDAEIRPSRGGVPSRTTIVSGFYKVETGKKHKVSEYNVWLKNFLQSVELPIVFFCAPSMKQFIAELRGDKPITIVSNWDTPFEMPPLEALGGYEWALAQHKIDPESFVHVPDVYGVWTAKPWIVKHATALNPYASEYFFWADAGGFRDADVVHTFRGLTTALDTIYDKVPSDTLVLSAVTVPMAPGTEYVKAARRTDVMDREDRLQGGWYGGKKAGIDWWERETRRVTTQQAALQRFAAKEQPVWTHAARLNWNRIYVQNMALREGDCGPDMWFGFEYFADGRDCRVPAWVGPHYAKLEGRRGDQWTETGKSPKWLGAAHRR